MVYFYFSLLKTIERRKPVPGRGFREHRKGLTLRDRLAIAVISGCHANEGVGDRNLDHPAVLVAYAYRVAELSITERAR